MAGKLVLSTKKSLYRPLTVEIDGTVYECKKLTRAFLKDFFKFETDALNGDLDAPYKQAQFAFGIPLKVLYELDAAELKDINNRVLDGIAAPDRITQDTSPNSKSPGDQKSS